MSKIQELKKELASIEKQIIEIQNECNHPMSARKIVDKGSTGGWDADEYWQEHICGLCEKFWTVEK